MVSYFPIDYPLAKERYHTFVFLSPLVKQKSMTNIIEADASLVCPPLY
jgi:hypothetical protein